MWLTVHKDELVNGCVTPLPPPSEAITLPVCGLGKMIFALSSSIVWIWLGITTYPLLSNTWNIGYLCPVLCAKLHVEAALVTTKEVYEPIAEPPPPAFNANDAVAA